MKRSLRSHLIVLIVTAGLSLLVACSDKQSSTNTTGSATPAPGTGAPVTSSAPVAVQLTPEQRVSQSIEQIKAMINNATRWKAAGHSYRQINQSEALKAGIIPKDLIRGDGAVVNVWGGAVAIEPHPEKDSFSILYSAVPVADCVQLALQGQKSFEVRTGSWGGIASNESQARAICTSGNMWFIPK